VQPASPRPDADTILEKVAEQVNASALGPNVTATVSLRKNKKARP
jgi:hypothetical protein